MILQALKEYYDRKAADPDNDIAPEGFEKKEIPFLVVIKPDGTFVNLEDTREHVGRKLIGKTYLLPRSQTRAGSRSHEKTFLLWDHIGYLFQFSKSDEQNDVKKAANQHQTWLDSLEALPNDLKRDEGVAAVFLFYKTDGFKKIKTTPNWTECIKLPACNMTFRLVGDTLPVPCRSKVQEYVRSSVSQVSGKHEEEQESKTKIFAYCLITGEYGEIARTHGRTPINKDTKSLVAFQKHSGYDSYRKEQCYNAPVRKSAEFAYTTALNTLLKSRSQRLQIADATTVFWSAKKSEFESVMPFFFSEPPKDDPDKYTDAVKSLYNSIWNGAYVIPNDDTRFYVLGLSPNAARIVVRFWKVGTVKEIGTRLKRHVDDLAITHAPGLNPALPMWKLLRSIAVREEDKNIPPNLGGDTMRSILEGLPYPQTLLQAAIRRIRAEHGITYTRAALIKACLNRSTRFTNPKIKEEMHVSLDPNNTNIGYRLGRLFATLERIQIRKHTQKGGKEPNSTILDKYYGSASGTPVMVFGTLIRLSKHHLASLENVGERINFEKLLSEIMRDISDFPAYLKLEDQGRFAIGYYHQMQDFFTKKSV